MPGNYFWNGQIELLNCCNWSMPSESKNADVNWKGCSRRKYINKWTKDLRKRIFNPWECHQARGEYHRLNRKARKKSKSYLQLSNNYHIVAIETELRFSWERNLKIKLPHVYVSFTLGWASFPIHMGRNNKNPVLAMPERTIFLFEQQNNFGEP